MRWLSVLFALSLVPALADTAPGQEVKSILRFEDGETAPPRPDGPAGEESEDASKGEEQGRQGKAGSARQGMLAEESEDGAGEPRVPGLPEALGLPGQPATLAPPDAAPPPAVETPPLPEAPPLVQPSVPGRRPVRPPGAAPADRGGVPEGIAPRPDTPKPFVYERAPVAVGTWSGYDAAVAPGPIMADPAVPPSLGSQQPGTLQRPLPRLAPYGYSLPPGESTPPAARPR